MKKVLFYSILLLAFAKTSSSQLVSFTSSNYFVGDEVKATVISTAAFQVENDIKKVSETIQPATTISLGRITAPGFYKFSFDIKGAKETYIICAGNRTDDITNGSVKQAPASLPQSDALKAFYDKVSLNLSKIDFSEVVKFTITEYVSTHVLSGTITLTACLSSGAVPALAIACTDGLKNEAKDVVFIFLTQLAENMFKKNIITLQQKNIFTTAVNSVSGVIDFFSAKGKVDKLLTAATIATQFATQNEVINLTVQQQKQLFDQTKILINVSKKLP